MIGAPSQAVLNRFNFRKIISFKSFGLYISISMLAACSPTSVEFHGLKSKICVPNGNLIRPPLWVESLKLGGGDSVAFKSCVSSRDGKLSQDCHLPKEVDSGVLLSLSRFSGWTWGDFTSPAYYKKQTQDSLDKGNYHIYSGDDGKVLRVPLDESGQVVYWTLSGSGVPQMHDSDEVLAVCDSHTSSNARSDDIGVDCDRFLRTPDYAIKYHLKNVSISYKNVKQMDGRIMQAIAKWKCPATATEGDGG